MRAGVTWWGSGERGRRRGRILPRVGRTPLGSFEEIRSTFEGSRNVIGFLSYWQLEAFVRLLR